MATARGKSGQLTIRTGFEGKPKGEIEASVYLFERSGTLITSAPLVKGEATFALDSLPRGTRAFVGPALDKTERASTPSLATMERLSAYEAPIKIERDRSVYELPNVPELFWPHWPLCRCRVRGRVMVRKTSANGVIVEAPVCNARVHICEVDRLPWLILRLPDLEIVRLRDELIELIRKPVPWPPEPDPGPLRDIIVQPQQLARRVMGNIDLVSLNPQPLPPEPPDHQARFGKARLQPGAAVAFNPQPDPPIDPFRALPYATQFALRSNASAVLRRALLDNLELVRPWICHWPWLHRWFYTSDELRVVTTDDQGRFDTSIWYLCGGDKPDLYFWVEYAIGGIWTTVHRPPIPCHIWWNYACGTDVTITVTDPRVPGCGEVPDLRGKQVVVKTIGREVSAGEINREPSILNPSADPAKAGTAQPMFSVSYGRESPFGATLEPRVDFGDGLKPAGVTHYRWSYRPLGSVSEADWIAIQSDVRRHYRELPAGPLAPTVYKSALVGPDPSIAGGYFFEVEPALPAGGDDWEVLDESYDLASAYLDTTGLLGKYELKLELFRKTGTTMTRVDLTAESVGINQILDPAPLVGPTYTATPASHDRLLIDPGTGHAVGYRLVVHIDNRPCFGTIASVSVAPGANDTKCGFLEYAPGASATLVFRASQPGDFASFGFAVARVATALPSAGAAGLVDAISVDGYLRSGNLFSKSVAVAALLSEGLAPGETPCTRAAFGESLYVYALATNGYGRLSGLDAPNAIPPGQIGLRAFAITPA
jgi:hypothetical protein